MNIEKITEKLKDSMTINGKVHSRFYHSLEVAKMAVELVQKHKLSLEVNKVYLAGLLHDATKLISKEEQKRMLYELGYKDEDEIMKSSNVWHGETAEEYLKKEYNINDQEILDSIKYHVMGKPNMTEFEKVIFIADYVERTRSGDVFDIARKLAFEDLNKALVYILEQQIKYITSLNQPLISQTLETYEYYKKEKNTLDG